MTPLFLGLAEEDWRALAYSLSVSSAAVLLSLPFGVALGYFLARRTFPGKALVETLVNLPLVLPPVVTGYLLLVLLGNVGRVFSREELLRRVWGITVPVRTRTVDIHIARLRRKLGLREEIRAVMRKGYRQGERVLREAMVAVKVPE